MNLHAKISLKLPDTIILICFNIFKSNSKTFMPPFNFHFESNILITECDSTSATAD